MERKNMDTSRDPRLARIEQLCREQDERSRQVEHRREREVEALKAAASPATIPETDTLRLTLLDRLAERCPELGNVGDHEVDWLPLDDGDEALVLDRSGFATGTGAYFVLSGDDVLAIGPIGSADVVGVVVIRPDGSRELLSATELG